ncbi:MAG: M14 family zinc carboxypeptidase [Thermoanaerobaculia bacterium]
MKRFLTLAALLTVPGGSQAWTPEELWELWPRARVVEVAAPCLRPDELQQRLVELARQHEGDLTLEEVGRSVEGRVISMLTLGHGSRRVLLWSQMHGDEPSATPALLDVVDFLLDRAVEDPSARHILDELTLLVVPMLNPDGAERYERRNAQGIDINRDARHLATPEGRILKRLRDTYEPVLGFNLHDQNRRTMVGDTGVLANAAVLAVAGDPEGTVTPGRMRAKRASTAVAEAVTPFFPGGVARYDEDWNPRAFGDNITAWGTPVVLIESGGLPPGRPFTDLTRFNFVALLRVLEDLSRDDLSGHDPGMYDALPRNRSDARVDVAVRGGRLLQPGAGPPYRADLTFLLHRDDRDVAQCRARAATGSAIAEIGDAHHLSAERTIDAEGAVLMPPLQAGVRGWRARRWLTAATLENLARLGVSRVLWQVSVRRLAAAQDHAAAVTADGRAALDAVTGERRLPHLQLDEPPITGEVRTLSDLLAALLGPRRWQDESRRPLRETLRRLWSGGSEAAGAPVLERGRPASFLMIESPLDEAALLAIWIDGVEVWRAGS